MKEVKPEFGINWFAISGIVYTIASVNEFFGKTENYSIGLQMMLLCR